MTMHLKALPPGAIELKGEAEGETGDLVTKALDDLKSTVDTRLAEIDAKTADLAKLTDRLNKIEVKIGRPAIGGKADTSDDSSIEKKAFADFMRGNEFDRKALRVADGTQGGFFAPVDFQAQLDRNLVLFSPVRQAARVGATAGSVVRLPRRSASFTASWVGEAGPKSGVQETYVATDLTVYEAGCYVDISNQLLEDAGIDVASELAYDFAEEFGRLEGAAFVNGDGQNKPLGFLNTPGITQVKTGNGTGFPASNPIDVITNLFYSLPSPYAVRATWGMNRTTIGVVRQFKDTVGRYIWSDPIQEGQPATLFGRPVVEMPDMPNVGAGTVPIVFGDFSNYRIFDRVALSVLRDPYSVQTSGLVRFHGRRRLAGGVTKPEAFRTLLVST